MAKTTIFEINGIRYTTPKAAGELWGLSSQKVTQACKDGRIIGAAVDSSRKWIIPVDAMKPLEKENIREILVAILGIKNRPGTPFTAVDDSATNRVFEYLRKTGYLEGNGMDDAILTAKGMDLATSGKAVSINWLNAASQLNTLINTAVTLIAIFK